jgi:hypothetical protein
MGRIFNVWLSADVPVIIPSSKINKNFSTMFFKKYIIINNCFKNKKRKSNPLVLVSVFSNLSSHLDG